MKIIAITGTDGTGKSTLCRNLCEAYPEYKEVSIWDAMEGGLFHTKKDIDIYLCTLSPNARLLFLSHALMQALEFAINSNAKVLLLNGYYYKYFASELALKADPELVNKMMATFPVPDLVIELIGDVDVNFSRKDKLSRYECGLQTPSLEAFKEFQKKIIVNFQTFERKDWITISSKRTIDEVFYECINCIGNWQK